MKKYYVSLFLLVVFLLLTYFCYCWQRPQLSKGLKEKFIEVAVSDSILDSIRDMGNISFNKFVEKVKNSKKEIEIREAGDSIEFIGKNEIDMDIFYKGEGSLKELKKIKNLPINIKNNGSFSAKINKKDTIKYIYIPYHILFSLVESTEGDSKNKSKKMNQKKSDSVTIKMDDNFDINNMHLISTEGLVKQNAFEIIKKKNVSGLKYKQMAALWEYVRDNWVYINDPNTGMDTWRPAEETIEDYYYGGGNNYAGDCDDFAILMASFAREIGFKSRIVTAFNNKKEGHAYSEFFVPKDEIEQMKQDLGTEINTYKENGGIWVNMDWFSEKIGGKPFNGKRVRVYYD